MCGCVKWLVLWSLWAARVVRQPTAAVRVGGGWLRGSVAHSGTHAHYLGIPYATLKSRFQAPGPEPEWNGVFEAIEENVRCRQAASLYSKYTMGQEDCMILNIYTPLNIPSDKPIPVMVFIHGGGFFQRSSSRMIYGPEYLTSKGVILVTLNYRLNIQGFLCLGIKDAPGNAGMKDQVAALKWIKRNIRAFGGNPENVTIFGESAGGASISYHVISPMSKGLFHKAIIQSGSSLSAWAFQYKPVYAASLLAKTMGFVSKDAHELYNFLIAQSDHDLIVNRVPRSESNTILSEVLFTPCAEQNIEGVEPFLTNSPYDSYIKGDFNQVPVLMGANTQEGLLFAGMDREDMIVNVKIDKAFPKDLDFPTNETRMAVAAEVQDLYMGNDTISVKTIAKISKFHGEPYINYPLLEETELLLKSNKYPIYHYLFAYESARNILKKLLSSELKTVKGATHADELFYLFSQQLIPSFFQTNMIEKMSTMWTNFAKYGDPTPVVSEKLPVRWNPVTDTDKSALRIDTEFTNIPLWYSDSLLFWREVYSKYRRKL